MVDEPPFEVEKLDAEEVEDGRMVDGDVTELSVLVYDELELE